MMKKQFRKTYFEPLADVSEELSLVDHGHMHATPEDELVYMEKEAARAARRKAANKAKGKGKGQGKGGKKGGQGRGGKKGGNRKGQGRARGN